MRTHLNCCIFFIIYYQNQSICTERGRKRDYQGDQEEQTAVRDRTKKTREGGDALRRWLEQKVGSVKGIK